MNSEFFHHVFFYTCPAKINLTLDILSQRPDGYHELASVVHQVGLFDELKVELNERGPIEFSCNQKELEGEDNLCVKALKVWNKATAGNIGAKIHLEKRIPTGAGLGGGSSNAAAMLEILNSATQANMPIEDLMHLGAKLGADVPLFLDSNAVLMEGIGEKISPLKRFEGWVVLAKPELSLSTPAVYRAWDEGGFSSQLATGAVLEKWESGNVGAICALLGNDLELAVAQLTDIPARLTQLLRESGALGAQMSGSGSACFGIYGTESAAQDAQKFMQGKLGQDSALSNTRLFVAPLC